MSPLSTASGFHDMPGWFMRRAIRHLVTVGALMFDSQGSILLVSHAHRQRARPTWRLPGGRMTVGETPEACLTRLMYDDTGCTVQVGPIVRVATVRRDEIALIFACMLIHDGDQPPALPAQSTFFSYEDLPATLSAEMLPTVTWAFAHRSAIRALFSTP